MSSRMGDVMSKRFGLLGLLLALALGTGVMAQEPEPTSLFAPEDLAFTIPSRVGDYELGNVGDVELDPEMRGIWRDLLLPLGKEPKDVREAAGKAYLVGQDANSSAEAAFGLGAIRVDGVPAAHIAEPFMAMIMIESLGDVPSAAVLYEWRVIDGRDVYSRTLSPEKLEEAILQMAAEQGVELTEQQLAELRAAAALVNAQAGLYLYPKGEVLFSIIVPVWEAAEDLPTVAEILAELP